jgi:CheY-like chemotaxis protein
VENLFKILIADRNPNVRDYLRRELGAEGYPVEEARDAREVLNRMQGEASPDVLILDLDLPYISETDLISRIKALKPSLPVVVYSYLAEYGSHPAIGIAEAVLEKKGDPEPLKKEIARIALKANK